MLHTECKEDIENHLKANNQSDAAQDFLLAQSILYKVDRALNLKTILIFPKLLFPKVIMNINNYSQ